MTAPPATVADQGDLEVPEDTWRSRRRRHLIGLIIVVLVIAAGAWVAIANPFVSKPAAGGGVSDNAYPTSLQAVEREDLSSQTEVSGTLTYAGATDIVLPAGTAPSELSQAQDAVAMAEQALGADESALQTAQQGNADTLEQSQESVPAAQATLAADEASLKSTEVANSQALAQAQASVQAAQATLASDEAGMKSTDVANSQTVTQAKQSVQAALATLASDQASLKSTEVANSQALAEAESSVQAAQAGLGSDEASLKSTEVANSQAVAQAKASVQAAQAALGSDEASLASTEAANSQALAQADQALQSARATLATDTATLSSDEATLSADEQKETADCRGNGAAIAKVPAASGPGSGSPSGSTPCATDQATVASQQAVVNADKQKVSADQSAVTSAQGNVPATKTKNTQTIQQVQSKLTADRQAITSAEANVAATKTKNTQTVQQIQSKLTTDQQAITSAEANVAATKTKNAQTVQQVQAKVTADEQALTSAGGNVASTKTKDTQTVQQVEAKLTADQQAISAAEADVAATRTKNTQSVQQVQAKVTADQQALSTAKGDVGATQVKDTQTAQQAAAQLAAAQLTLSQDKATLSTDEQEADVAGESSTYTELPTVGQVVSRGQELFAIGGQPVVLLYGTVTPWRAFAPGMTPGEDVEQLNANLAALGYGHGLMGNNFTAATEAALLRLQSAVGLSPTGQLPVGSVDFQPGAIRVTAVSPNLGATVAPGQAVISVTLLSRQVQVALDSSLQSDVKDGDEVSIVMPNNSTLPGTVTYVGTVATVPSANSGGGNPTINVDITPDNPAATGTLDQLPVEVWITEGTANNALVLPVDALLALAGGGYAVEAVGAGGVHHLVGVTLGLFDDADGLVQVSGPGIFAGQKVVVPNV